MFYDVQGANKHTNKQSTMVILFQDCYGRGANRVWPWLYTGHGCFDWWSALCGYGFGSCTSTWAFYTARDLRWFRTAISSKLHVTSWCYFWVFLRNKYVLDLQEHLSMLDILGLSKDELTKLAESHDAIKASVRDIAGAMAKVCFFNKVDR